MNATVSVINVGEALSATKNWKYPTSRLSHSRTETWNEYFDELSLSLKIRLKPKCWHQCGVIIIGGLCWCSVGRVVWRPANCKLAPDRLAILVRRPVPTQPLPSTQTNTHPPPHTTTCMFGRIILFTFSLPRNDVYGTLCQTLKHKKMWFPGNYAKSDQIY